MTRIGKETSTGSIQHRAHCRAPGRGQAWKYQFSGRRGRGHEYHEALPRYQKLVQGAARRDIAHLPRHPQSPRPDQGPRQMGLHPLAGNRRNAARECQEVPQKHRLPLF